MNRNKFQPHFVLLCEKLNMDKLLPYLRQEKMVTNDEYETLTNVAYTTKQQREKLLILLPRKGKFYFENFGKCLVWSGQREIARHIGVDVDSIPPPPYEPEVVSVSDQVSNQALLQQIKNLISSSDSGPATLASPSSSHPPPPSYRSTEAPPSAPPLAPAPSSGQQLPPPPQRNLTWQGVTESSEMPPGAHTPHTGNAPHTGHPPSSAHTPYDAHPSYDAHPPYDAHQASNRRLPQPTKVFILYCKDETLEDFGVTGDEFCRDVLELVDILVYCGGIGPCIVDFYEQEEQQSWNAWTVRKMAECTHVLVVCSRQLIEHLTQPGRQDVFMERGMFFSDAVINTIIAPKFVPVFLNASIPRDYKSWVPAQLHGSRHYRLHHLRELYASLHAQQYSEEERSEMLMRNLGSSNYEDLARLVKYLRNEPDVIAPIPPRQPVPVPYRPPQISSGSPIGQRHVPQQQVISDDVMLKVAAGLPREWIRLGVKLGVEYTTLVNLGDKYLGDYMQAVLEMFAIWQRVKGPAATKQALKRALMELGYSRLAKQCYPHENI